MANVTMDQLAVRVKLDPKIIRRIIRKELPDLAGHGKYLFNDENPRFTKLIEACETYTKQKSKPKPEKQKRERKSPETKWDDRGLCIIGGGVWTTVLVPTKADPSLMEAQTVYLGKQDDVEAVLQGKKPIPDGINDRARCAFDELMAPQKRKGEK